MSTLRGIQCMLQHTRTKLRHLPGPNERTLGRRGVLLNVRHVASYSSAQPSADYTTSKDRHIKWTLYNTNSEKSKLNSVNLLPISYGCNVRTFFSSSGDKNKLEKSEQNEKSEDDGKSKKTGIMKRFHNAYKEYGKALIAVHGVTSAVWFGSFYYAAVSGVDIIPILQSIGLSESVIEPLRKSGLGHAATAYLLYKLATPVRYPVTIGGTQLCARYLRKMGYWEPVKKEDSIRELVKEGRIQAKEKRKQISQDLKDEMKEFREDVSEKVTDFKSNLKRRKDGDKSDDSKK